MRVLALDTTTAVSHAALLDGDRVIGAYAGDEGRSQAEQLPGGLIDMLTGAGWNPADVDAFAIASGPGSFTGLRIGIATVQGLAMVTGRPVVPISVLDALAQIGSDGEREGTFVGAWMDARRGEVFTAVYRVGTAAVFTASRLTMIESPSVGPPASAFARWVADGHAPRVLAGDGAAGEEAGVPPSVRVQRVPSVAAALARMAAGKLAAGETCGPGDVRPLYVRRPDAVLARERLGASR